jgi:hypothetical protein
MTAIVSRLRVTVALGTIAGLLLSHTLWLNVRTYPLAPLWDLLHPVPPPFDYLVLGAMLGLDRDRFAAGVAGRRIRRNCDCLCGVRPVTLAAMILPIPVHARGDRTKRYAA